MNDLRSVVIHGNLLPVHSSEVDFRGEIDGQNLHDLWVREMTIAGLDFKNPVGLETFNCFKRICIIECNTNKSSRSEPSVRENSTIGAKKPMKSSHNVQQMETENSDIETDTTNVTGPPPRPWNPPAGLKFPCPLGNHKHEVSICSEFFNLTLLDRWKKI